MSGTFVSGLKDNRLLVKIFALLFLCSTSAMASFSGYNYERKVTISSTIAGGSFTDFPVVFISTDISFSTASISGHMKTVFDLIASTVSDCSVKLSVDTETFNNGVVGSTLTAWVKIPVITTTTLTGATFYWCYGQSGITSYQGNSKNVWSNNFAAVYHFPDGSSFISPTPDSTGSNNGTVTSVTATPGIFGGGASFSSPSGISTNYKWINTSDPRAFTLSAWVQTTSTPASNAAFISNSNSVTAELDLYQTPSNTLGVFVQDSGGSFGTTTSGSSITGSSWVYVAYTGATFMAYINGVQDGAPPSTNPLTGNFDSGGFFNIGKTPSNAAYFTGRMDEARISTVARPAIWILAEYRNQSSPKTFTVIGPELFSASEIPQSLQIRGTTKIKGNSRFL